MSQSNRFALAILAFTLGFAAPAARADIISSIVPAVRSVTLDREGRATVAFTVSGSRGGSELCGININYGDGDSPDTRVIGQQEGPLPRVFEHSFNRAGQFAVVAKGDRVKGSPSCNGDASTTINVVAASAGRRQEAYGAACPSGWSEVRGSYVRRTGAFSCAPDYPAERMDCGRGLSYFEAAGSIGCRPRDRADRDDR